VVAKESMTGIKISAISKKHTFQEIFALLTFTPALNALAYGKL